MNRFFYSSRRYFFLKNSVLVSTYENFVFCPTGIRFFLRKIVMSPLFFKLFLFFTFLFLPGQNIVALAQGPEPTSANVETDNRDLNKEAAESITARIDSQFGIIVENMANVLFWEPVKAVPIPLIVIILLCGSVFFTIYHKWLNIRGFKHAIDITRGRYDNPNDPGEISHFQALTSALSATVGLGNIAGVAVAIQTGGPGAVVWMVLIGLFGMTAKFNECTLAMVYRKVRPDGTVDGGPMHYLEIGLQERGFPFAIAKCFGLVFAIFCIGGSFGGGNMFQANQATSAVRGMIGDRPGLDWFFGCLLAFLVGLVIIGGIKRIGQVTEKIIPLMCGIYVLAGIIILILHANQIPEAAVLIVRSCVSPEAAYGGFIGVLVQGIRRAVFSNEAGVGSAAIAHAAAKTDEPVREGMVAMLGPFIDTVVICTMTALVVIVSGAYNTPEAGQGVEMTRWAFSETLSWFPTVLNISVFLFAYSTMISWSYYGEKAWQYIFGTTKKAIIMYRILFLGFIVLGAVASLENVITFSDLMILSMAFPNIIGGVILAPRVKVLLQDYWRRYKANEFTVYE